MKGCGYGFSGAGFPGIHQYIYSVKYLAKMHRWASLYFKKIQILACHRSVNMFTRCRVVALSLVAMLNNCREHSSDQK